MSALIVFVAEDTDRVAAYLIENCGFQKSMQGYNNVEGGEGSIHRAIESDLPDNALYHPELDAKDAYRTASAWLNFNGVRVGNIVAFNVDPHWHGGQSRFDRDKPFKRWEDFKNPPQE